MLIRLLQVSTATVFLGRAWQHLFWDAPFRAFFWDERLLKGIVEGWFGRPWDEYVTDLQVGAGIDRLIVAFGILYLLCGITALFVRKVPIWLRHILLLGALGLFLLAIMYWKEKFYHWGQLFEYALQVGSPVFLWVSMRPNVSWERLIRWMKIATALTFVCHGLYAVAYYPRPELFTSMTMNILGIEEMAANQFLLTVGVLDFVAAAVLFLPGKWAIPGLVYCVLWGFATAIARIWANYYPDFWASSLHQWAFQAVYRFPHGLIPLALLIWPGFLPFLKGPRARASAS